MIRLRSSLTTRLHRQLASPEWIRTLEALVATRVRQSGQFKTDSGSGSVTSKFSHERFMGPHSIVKYRFLVAVQVSRGPETEPDRYEARVVWHPAAMSFSLEGEVYTTVEGAAAQRSRTQLEIGVARSVDSTDSLSAFSRLSCHICRSPLEIEWYSKGLTWRCWCRQRPSHFSQDGGVGSRERVPAWLEQRPADRICPECDSPEHVVGISYGRRSRGSPPLDEKVWIAFGCIVGDDRWHCRSCSRSFPWCLS